jgi:hypothetical protein
MNTALPLLTGPFNLIGNSIKTRENRFLGLKQMILASNYDVGFAVFIELEVRSMKVIVPDTA